MHTFAYSSFITKLHKPRPKYKHNKLLSASFTESVSFTWEIVDHHTYAYDDFFQLQADHSMYEQKVQVTERTTFLYNITFGDNYFCTGDKRYIECAINGVTIPLKENGVILVNSVNCSDVEIEYLQLQYKERFSWTIDFNLEIGKVLHLYSRYDSAVSIATKSNCKLLTEAENPMDISSYITKVYAHYYRENNQSFVSRNYNTSSYSGGYAYTMHSAWQYHPFMTDKDAYQRWKENGGWEFVTWAEAEADCQNRSGHLISIHSKKEADIIKHLLPHDHFIPAVYIGLKHKVCALMPYTKLDCISGKAK